jgi:flagellar biosynthesis protein FlhB
MKFHYSRLKYRIRISILNFFKFLYSILNIIIVFVAALIFLPVRLIQLQQNSSSSLKTQIKLTFINVFNFYFLLFSLLVIFATVIAFIPARLIAFGPMIKLSNYLLNIHDLILGYFVTKIFYMMYC